MLSDPTIFEPLPMRRRSVVPISPEEYAIISRSGEVREVKASTAYEAFKLSGFSEAIRIERKAAAKQPVLSKTRFMDEAMAAMEGEMSESLNRRKSPVVSANDLDSLMRALAAEHNIIPTEQSDIPQIITSPTGVEVHGDGFDELIPATVAPMQMTGIKSAADTISLEEKPLPEPEEAMPQQELTADEVANLLKG